MPTPAAFLLLLTGGSFLFGFFFYLGLRAALGLCNTFLEPREDNDDGEME